MVIQLDLNIYSEAEFIEQTQGVWHFTLLKFDSIPEYFIGCSLKLQLIRHTHKHLNSIRPNYTLIKGYSFLPAGITQNEHSCHKALNVTC